MSEKSATTYPYMSIVDPNQAEIDLNSSSDVAKTDKEYYAAIINSDHLPKLLL